MQNTFYTILDSPIYLTKLTTTLVNLSTMTSGFTKTDRIKSKTSSNKQNLKLKPNLTAKMLSNCPNS